MPSHLTSFGSVGIWNKLINVNINLRMILMQKCGDWNEWFRTFTTTYDKKGELRWVG